MISAGVRVVARGSRLGVLGFSVSGIKPVALDALTEKLLEQFTALMAGTTRHGWRWKALAWRERMMEREAVRVAWVNRRDADGADMMCDVLVFDCCSNRQELMDDDNGAQVVWRGYNDGGSKIPSSSSGLAA